MSKIKDRWGANAAPKMEGLISEAEDQMTKQVEIDFVKSIRESFNKYGEHTWLSDKQHDWLKRIAEGEDTQDTYERFNRAR